MTNPSKITMVGCGKMGSALLEGWIESLPDFEFGVIKPSPLPASTKDKALYGKNAAALAEHIKNSGAVVMAVKPQVMEQVCAEIKPYISKNTLIISIAAGQSLDNFARYFGEDQPVVRTMPNTPAAIGKGMSAAVANKNVTAARKTLVGALLHSAGEMEWVEDESLLDAVTAVSGSGPAYVFYLIEAMSKAGEAAGLKPKLAARLARQTVIGAAALAEAQPDITAAKLRENVTSPNGTTAAALDVLMNGEMQGIFTKAIAAAKARGEELS